MEGETAPPLAQYERNMRKARQDFAISVNCSSPNVAESQLIFWSPGFYKCTGTCFWLCSHSLSQQSRHSHLWWNFSVFLVKIRSFIANELTGGMECRIWLHGCGIQQWEWKIKINGGFPPTLEADGPRFPNSLALHRFSRFYSNQDIWYIRLIACLSYVHLVIVGQKVSLI